MTRKLDCSILIEYADAYKAKKIADGIFSLVYATACINIENTRPPTSHKLGTLADLAIGELTEWERQLAFDQCVSQYRARVKARKIFGRCKAAILIRGRKLKKELT